MSSGSSPDRRSRAANPAGSHFIELLRCVAEEHDRVLSRTTALASENTALTACLLRAQDVITRHNLPCDLLVPSSAKQGGVRRERAATLSETTRNNVAATASIATGSTKTSDGDQLRPARINTSPELPVFAKPAKEGSHEIPESDNEQVTNSQDVAPEYQDLSQLRGGRRTETATSSKWHRALDKVMGRANSAHHVNASSCKSDLAGNSTLAHPARNLLPPLLTFPIPKSLPSAATPPEDVPAMLPIASRGDNLQESPTDPAQSVATPHSGAYFTDASTPVSPAADDVSGSGLADQAAMPPVSGVGSMPQATSPSGVSTSDTLEVNVGPESSERSMVVPESWRLSLKEHLPALLSKPFSVRVSFTNGISKVSSQPRRLSQAMRHWKAMRRQSHALVSSGSNSSGSERSEPDTPKSGRKERRRSSVTLGQIDLTQVRLGPERRTGRFNTVPFYRRRRQSQSSNGSRSFSGTQDLVRDETSVERGITLLVHWQELKINRPSGGILSSPFGSHRNSRSWLQFQSEEQEKLRFQLPRLSWIQSANRFIVRPGSKSRITWDFFGMMLILYDLVSIPMQIFDPPSNIFTEVMMWLTTAFWTADIPFSFFTGFYRDGVLEASLDQIARHYARTWFCFDIVVISVDWCLTVAGEVSSAMAADSVGYMRLGKTLRFLRLLRLLRLLKVQGLLSDFIERVQSEFCLIMLGIARVIVSIMLINHLIACSWYGIGTVFEGRVDTWVYQNNLHDKELGYKYTTALHWSLTQFTPASMEVVPENALERVFAVCVLLFAMVTFSSLVSSITNAMTQLRNLNSEQIEQTAMLRRYLGENKISVALMGRVWGCTQQVMDKSKSRIHEKDVAILALLPSTLKGDLQEEVYFPVLSPHPFFRQLASTYPAVVRKIYQQAVHEVSTGAGQELFNGGDEGSRMMFILSGLLVYTLENQKVEHPSALITAGHFVSEAVLWICWKHAGQLAASTHSELVEMLPESFFTAVAEILEPQRYARSFANHFQDCPEKLTDVFSDCAILEEFAIEAFTVEDDACDLALDPELEAASRRGSTKSSFADRLMGLVPPMSGDRRPSINPLLNWLAGGQRMPSQTESGSGVGSQEDGSSDHGGSPQDMEEPGDEAKSDSASSKQSGMSGSILPWLKGNKDSLGTVAGAAIFGRMRGSAKVMQDAPAIDEASSPNAIDSDKFDSIGAQVHTARCKDTTANDGSGSAEALAQGPSATPDIRADSRTHSINPIMHNAWR